MPAVPAVPAALLIGRDRELGLLEGVLNEALAGNREAAVVEGEPGIGKTLLLAAAAARAADLGFDVVRAGARELERGRAFGPLIDALLPRAGETQRAELEALLTGPRRDRGAPGTGADAEFRLVSSFERLAERLSTRRPLLLVVDDLQWADLSTLIVLHRLGKRRRGRPFALLLATRGGPRRPEVDQVVDDLVETGAARVVLNPLGADDIRALVRDRTGAEPGPALYEQLAVTGGNPLFAVELLEALASEGTLKIAKGEIDLQAPVLPLSLQRTMLRRIEALTERTRGVLSLASLLGSSFAHDELSVAFERDLADLLPAIGEATAAGILEEQGERLAFRHDLVRDAVYLGMPEAVRRALHRQAGRALAGSGAPASSVAPHVSVGASRGDREAIEWLLRAARDALERAPGIAAAQLERAVALMPADHPGRDLALTDLALALVWTGRLDEGERRAREGLSLPHDPALDARLHYALGWTLLLRARGIEALQELERTLAAMEPEDAGRGLVMAIAAGARVLTGDAAGGAALAEQARAAAESRRDEKALARALWALSVVAYLRGRVEETVELALEAARASGGEVLGPMDPYIWLGTALCDLDRLDEGERALLDGRERPQGMAPWQVSWYPAQLGLHRFLAARWDEALIEFDRAARLQEPGWRPWSKAFRAVIEVHRGDLAAAEADLETAEGLIASGAQMGVATTMWARALLLEARGDDAAAAAILENAWTMAHGLGIVPDYVRFAPDVVRLAIRHGNGDLARGVAGAMDEAAAVNPAPGWRAAALRCRGLTEGDPELLLRAVETYRTTQRHFDLAAACEDAATASGEDDEGRIPLLQEALELYERIGASRDADRARATLRRLGIRPASRPRRGAVPATGWESLTTAERRVVDLVADGLSNREIAERLFISPRTVETHVAHVLSKVGVASKVALAAEAARRRGSLTDEPVPSRR